MAGGSRSSIRGTIAIVVALVLTQASSAMPALIRTPLAQAAAVAPSAPVFPGSLLGTPTIAAPVPANFVYACNVSVNAQAVTAAGAPIAAGTAIHNLDG